MTVNVQPTLEIQVKMYGAEAERMKIVSEHLKMTVDQFIAYAIKQLVQEILEYDNPEKYAYALKVRPEVKQLRELIAQLNQTEEQEETTLKVELANYKPLSDKESIALAKRLSEGGVSSLDVIKEREEGW